MSTSEEFTKPRRPYWRNRGKQSSELPKKEEDEKVPEKAKPSTTNTTNNNRPKQVRSGPQVTNRTLPQNAFKPKALSNEDSHMKNDPLITNCVLLEGLTVVAPSPKQTFSIDVSQYLTIVRDLYVTMTRDKQFKQRVSLAMFEYYATILLWRRIIYVLSETERSRTAAENFIAALPANLCVPEEIGRYLDGIGNFVDSAGRESVLRLLQELDHERICGMPGHYGQVDQDTHVVYETMISPFVTAYRMCYEYMMYVMKSTPPPPPLDDEDDDPVEEPDMPTEWNLPPALRPVGNFVPNRNLLGWYKATDITREMAKEFDQVVDIDADDRTFTARVRSVENIPIFYDVLKLVSLMLGTSKTNADSNKYASESVFQGSRAQQAYVTRVLNDYGHNDSGMRLQPLAERMLQTEMNAELGPHLTSAATIFRYRIQRHVGMSSDCLCYTGRRGQVPHGWLQNANAAFEHGRWNHPDFNGPQTTGTHVSEKFIDATRKIHRLDR